MSVPKLSAVVVRLSRGSMACKSRRTGTPGGWAGVTQPWSGGPWLRSAHWAPPWPSNPRHQPCHKLEGSRCSAHQVNLNTSRLRAGAGPPHAMALCVTGIPEGSSSQLTCRRGSSSAKMPPMPPLVAPSVASASAMTAVNSRRRSTASCSLRAARHHEQSERTVAQAGSKAGLGAT